MINNIYDQLINMKTEKLFWLLLYSYDQLYIGSIIYMINNIYDQEYQWARLSIIKNIIDHIFIFN